ncbi:unnamed protein product [Sphagnum jensenii]|uniref:U6 snRNA phosphodiesterase n=1 Tax=Sphagnum jensenii TaxID=128206 RepID=A0ABP1B530_9BRYO
MDALQLYASDSDSDTGEFTARSLKKHRCQQVEDLIADRNAVHALPKQSPRRPLPSPPPEFLKSFPDLDECGGQGRRVRTFPHVEGNFSLHVFIPVALSTVVRSKLVPYLRKAAELFPGLQSMEEDFVSPSPRGISLANEYHISLGRTVPIRIHQIDTIVSMLRNKFRGQKQFWMEFGSWEVFINDEHTRSFLSLEIVAVGNPEIKKQVSLVDEVYKLHNLPAFYKNPRPHISLAWALGDVTEPLVAVAAELNRLMENGEMGVVGVRAERKWLWSSHASRVECKIGQKLFPIWTANP